ncbi:MAG: hypothetical protein SNG02_03250 [Rikenellaceae bacterium]
MNRLSLLLVVCLTTFTSSAYLPLYGQQSDKEKLETLKSIGREIHEKEQQKCDEVNTMPNIDGFSPGKYQIVWDKSVLSQNENIFCINIPITPQYRYQASRTNKNGKEQMVNIMQRLLLYKNKKSGSSYEQIQTMVPDKNVSKSWYKSYLHPGNETATASFSGMTIFSNTITGETNHIQIYNDGDCIYKISRLSKNNPKWEENNNKMREIIASLEITPIKAK